MTSEWSDLLDTFAALTAGRFDHDSALLRLIESSPDRAIRFCGLRILGHSATRDDRVALTSLFSHLDEDTRLAAYDAALFCGDLRTVDPLLTALGRARGEERLTIMSRLSHLLEPEPDALYDDVGQLSAKEYEGEVLRVRAACQARYGVDAAVFEGRPSSLRYLLERVENLCTGGRAHESSGTISMYFDRIEAMTGHPTTGIFDRGVEVDPEAAIASIENLRRPEVLRGYADGARYFFGHRVPS